MWEQLTKKGYEITNKRVLGNPAYTSEQTRHKDLVQELALVQDWLLNNYNYLVTVRPDKDKFRILLYFEDTFMFVNAKKYKTNQDALRQGIEYTINNLI